MLGLWTYIYITQYDQRSKSALDFYSRCPVEPGGALYPQQIFELAGSPEQLRSLDSRCCTHVQPPRRKYVDIDIISDYV